MSRDTPAILRARCFKQLGWVTINNVKITESDVSVILRRSTDGQKVLTIRCRSRWRTSHITISDRYVPEEFTLRKRSVVKRIKELTAMCLNKGPLHPGQYTELTNYLNKLCAGTNELN